MLIKIDGVGLTLFALANSAKYTHGGRETFRPFPFVRTVATASCYRAKMAGYLVAETRLKKKFVDRHITLVQQRQYS